MQRVRKSLSFLVAVFLVFGLVPLASAPVLAAADGAVSYIERSWNAGTGTVQTKEKTVSSYTKLSGLTDRQGITLKKGWYVVDKNLTFKNRVFADNCNLILSDGVTLNLMQGIQITNSVRIYSQSKETGTLRAYTTKQHEAAIGAVNTGRLGRLYIHGGTVKATASAAKSWPIGFENAGLSSSITILGGKIICTNGDGTSEAGIFIDPDRLTVYGGQIQAAGFGNAKAGISTAAGNKAANESVSEEEDAAEDTDTEDQTTEEDEEDDPVPEHEHELVEIPAADPTADEDGCIAHYECVVCGKVFEDAEGTKELSREEVEIPYLVYEAEGTKDIKVTGYNGTDEDLEIPDTVPDYYYDEELQGGKITVIGKGAFEKNEIIKSVEMGDNLEIISQNAFSGCTALEEVSVGTGLTAIGTEAFADCPKLLAFSSDTAEAELSYGRAFAGSSSVVIYGLHAGPLKKLASSYSIPFTGTDRHEAVWDWNLDGEKTTAVMNCENCIFSAEGKVTAERSGNIWRYTAAAEDIAGEIYTAHQTQTITPEDDPTPTERKYNLKVIDPEVEANDSIGDPILFEAMENGGSFGLDSKAWNSMIKASGILDELTYPDGSPLTENSRIDIEVGFYVEFLELSGGYGDGDEDDDDDDEEEEEQVTLAIDLTPLYYIWVDGELAEEGELSVDQPVYVEVPVSDIFDNAPNPDAINIAHVHGTNVYTYVGALVSTGDETYVAFVSEHGFSEFVFSSGKIDTSKLAGGSGSDSKTGDAVKTGDESNLTLWIILLAAAAAAAGGGIAVYLVRKKKSEE